MKPLPFRVALIMASFALGSASVAQDAADASMRILETPSGARFGVFGPKPAAPAPTLLVFATSLEQMARHPIYTETGRRLASRGWVYAAIEPPCHGRDHKDGEPAELMGWAYRVKQGEDLMGPFLKRSRDVLDHLIKEGYADPQRIAAIGTSRGGFCALHFAASEPRVRAVACVSPVTNLPALREFKDVDSTKTDILRVARLADKLADRAIWIGIGNNDSRVSTEDCVSAFSAFIAAARERRPEPKVIPMELIVGPSAGHQSVNDAYGLAAEFLRKTVETAAKPS